MKAILVTDMPKNCYKCNLQVRNVVGNRICVINNKDADYCASTPKWCPLRAMPEKKEDYQEGVAASPRKEFEWGWNACIDEILKGSEET